MMYCPKCGQQVSDSMRFCSRCGLPIGEVGDWLAGLGGLVARDTPQASAPSPRRKGMRRGAKVMFWGGMLLPLFFGLSLAVDDPVPLIVPLMVILTGLSWLLYSRLFGEEAAPERIRQAQEEAASFGAARAADSALPPASDAGVINSARRNARTAEIAQPPSVTDHTTKLLDRE